MNKIEVNTMLRQTLSLLVLICSLCFVAPVSAEVQTIEADGYYIMGDGLEENQVVAKERAKANAKRSAAEQAGIFIESISEVKDGKLTKDEIRTIASTVLQIKSDEVNLEVEGKSVKFHCHIVALVDTANVTPQLKQDKKELEEATQRLKEMEKENARINTELAALKEKFKVASEPEKQEIKAEVKRNETQFTAVLWFEKGNAYHDHRNKIACYLKAVEIDPKYAEAWYNLGRSYHMQASYDEAIDCYLKVIDIDPEYADGYCYLGIAYDEREYSNNKRLSDEAIKYYLKAVNINPKYAFAWNRLGNAYSFRKQYDKAVEYYRKAVESDPNFWQYWKNLGFAYYNQKRYQEALNAYDEALKFDPNDKYAKEMLNKCLINA